MQVSYLQTRPPGIKNVNKYKCHLTIDQWNIRINLIINLSKRNSKKKKLKKKSEKYISVMSADATTRYKEC